MAVILCYGDSNTWGSRPDTGERFVRNIRWPGVMQNELGPEYHVVEEGLCGRTTCHDDPFSPGRNGLAYLPVALDSHSPIDLLILMLGTNDLKIQFALPPYAIARGASTLVECAIERGVAASQILLVSPLPVVPTGNEHNARMFTGAVEKSRALIEDYRHFALQHGCHFFDGSAVGSSSEIDGIHLDGETHLALGKKMAELIRKIV